MIDKKCVMRIMALSFAALFVLTITLYSAPPKVVCVPFYAPNPAIPHDTWNGKEITLKGTAKDISGDPLATYQWDFGDGSPTVSGVVTNPYVIEAKHAYSGNIGDKFVARLTVTSTGGWSSNDDYLVEIRDETVLKVKVNVAIDEGLWLLHKQQIRGTYGDGAEYGYWNYGYPYSATGACAEAFEIHGHLPDGNTNHDPYVETVRRSLNYLLANMRVAGISPQGAGDPDVNGNGIGIYVGSSRSMYENGIVLMTFASSKAFNMIAETGPVNVKNRAFKDIVQDMVDYLAFGQVEPNRGSYRGGWRYSANYSSSDNSVSQWPTIGFEAAEANFGAPPVNVSVPQFVKDELNRWIGYIQCGNGGSGYTSPCSWANVAKTGGLLCEMKFVGDDVSAARAQNAVSFISANWNSTSWDYGNLGDYYAMYSVMKGFSLLGIDKIDPLGTGFDWYADPNKGYAPWLVSHQNGDGSWGSSIRVSHPLTTAWAILILQLTPVEPGPVADAGPDVSSHPPVIPVSFDASGSYHKDPNMEIIEYCWDFDASDGVDWENPDACSDVPEMEHAFPAVYDGDEIDWDATTKDYTVSLRVKDNNAEDPKYNFDEVVISIKPPPWPPVVVINAPDYASKCEEVTLDGSDSYDPNGQLYPDPEHPWYSEITDYEWDLNNDGVYGDEDGETVPWSSCDQGLYVIGLKVTNTFDATDEKDVTISVGNKPPVADAGGQRSCSAGEIVFDGSGSADPDPGETETLQYRWDFEDDGSYDTDWSDEPTAAHTYPVCQEYTVRLQVKDEDGATGTATAKVLPNAPPVADAGEDLTVEQETPNGTTVLLDGRGSTDPDDNIESYCWYEGEVELGCGETLDYMFQLGSHDVTLVVTDTYGETSSDEVTITVEDTRSPVIELSADPNKLWPPNHKMVPVEVMAVVSDICDVSPECRITGVSSNEPVNGTGDGDMEPDWDITGDLTVDLRAERAGPLNSRVYTVTVECTDFSGNPSTSTVEVRVEHDQGKGEKK